MTTKQTTEEPLAVCVFQAWKDRKEFAKIELIMAVALSAKPQDYELCWDFLCPTGTPQSVTAVEQQFKDFMRANWNTLDTSEQELIITAQAFDAAIFEQSFGITIGNMFNV